MLTHTTRDADLKEAAIHFAMRQILRASDWQDVQHALADHPRFGPWLDEGGNANVDAQAIICQAERRLGNQVPY